MKTVKRMIAAVLLLALLALALVGCSSPPPDSDPPAPEAHTPVQSAAIAERVWGFDLLITEASTSEKPAAVDLSYTITIDGVTYNGTCHDSPGKKEYLYFDKQQKVHFGIRNGDTLTRFAANENLAVGKLLSEEECVEIGTMFISKYVDLFDYPHRTITKNPSPYQPSTHCEYYITYYKTVGEFTTPEYTSAIVREDGFLISFTTSNPPGFPNSKINLHGLTVQAAKDEAIIQAEEYIKARKQPDAYTYEIESCDRITRLSDGRYAIACKIVFWYGANFAETLYLILAE